MATYSTSRRNESLAFQDRDLMFWSTMLLRNKDNGTHLSISATECILEYCVREFSSNVTNGTLFENSFPVTTAKRSPRSWVPGGQVSINWTIEDTWSSADDLNLARKPVGIRRTDLMVGNGYSISQIAVLGIENMLKSVLTTDGRSGSVPYDNDLSAPFATPIFFQPLFESDDLTATFENIAISMTNVLRADADTGLENNTISAAAGQLGFAVSVYKVKWPWIALPSTLVLHGCFFLWLGCWYSKEAGIPSWKSCPIALTSMATSIHGVVEPPLRASELHAVSDQLYERLLELGGRGFGVSSPAERTPNKDSARLSDATRQLLHDLV
ncbi:hypothetical protein EJ08DRAFT_727262 [Tothia fuscella]|uniref:Uncharacterized protein n=1 Tax=Tothia fuscella TaxID=1048955 RepID=A0A9P4TTN7_9PEZI|nr:hypothetical protein EJ08DRAFT_727262 [Tothia fuscella]